MPPLTKCEMPLLTRRESELYNFLIGTSLDVKSIAHRMGLSSPTVKVYTSRLYQKLSVSGRVEIMRAEIVRLGAEIERLTNVVKELSF